MDQQKKKPVSWLIKAYGWATDLLYHSFAWAYDLVAWLVSFGQWTQWRRDSLAYLQPGSILEVGFGTGELLIAMAEMGLNVVGLEFSPQMQRVTRRKLRQRNLSIPRVRGRSEALPFSSDSFDNVVVTFPSNYIARTETLTAFFRVLKKQGKVIVAGLTVRFTRRWKNAMTGWFLNDPTERVVTFLADKARDVGFRVTVISHEGQGYVQPILILEKPDDD